MIVIVIVIYYFRQGRQRFSFMWLGLILYGVYLVNMLIICEYFNMNVQFLDVFDEKYLYRY